MISYKYSILPFCIMVILTLPTMAQNYNSQTDGDWAMASTWTNTSGWGNATPSTSGSYGTKNISHQITYTGNLTASGTTNLNTGGSVNLQGNLSISGGSTINVYQGSILYVQGDLTLNGYLRIYPGGKVVVTGSVHIYDSEYLHVGDNTGGTTYADMVIRGDLEYHGGRANVNSNGRMAILGGISGNSNGGTVFTVNQGGQVYVHDDIFFKGGGDQVINNNTTDPYGLYVNGKIKNNGGGAVTTANTGTQQEMIDTNRPFAEWVSVQEQSPLASVLPISIDAFYINSFNDHSLTLQWIVNERTNNLFITVLRSRDAIVWEEIGVVNSDGKPEANDIEHFEDNSLLNGISYYQLKIEDVEGQVVYSPVLSHYVKNDQYIQVYPNPTADLLNISNTAGSFIEAQLFDSEGREVKYEQSTSSFSMDLTGLKQGIYIIHVFEQSEMVYSKRVVKI